jgi:hypothetical protein
MRCRAAKGSGTVMRRPDLPVGPITRSCDASQRLADLLWQTRNAPHPGRIPAAVSGKQLSRSSLASFNQVIPAMDRGRGVTGQRALSSRPGHTPGTNPRERLNVRGSGVQEIRYDCSAKRLLRAGESLAGYMRLC